MHIISIATRWSCLLAGTVQVPDQLCYVGDDEDDRIILYLIHVTCSLVHMYSSGEEHKIDHLVFVIHGIGAYHDLSFRTLVDCGEWR